MSPDPAPHVVESLEWQGVTIRMSYDPDWGGLSELGLKHQVTHVVLEVLEPARLTASRHRHRLSIRVPSTPGGGGSGRACGLRAALA